MNNIEYLPEDNFEDAIQRGWNGPGWYFWDEADGQYCYGPFTSISLAQNALEEYSKQL